MPNTAFLVIIPCEVCFGFNEKINSDLYIIFLINVYRIENTYLYMSFYSNIKSNEDYLPHFTDTFHRALPSDHSQVAGKAQDSSHQNLSSICETGSLTYKIK